MLSVLLLGACERPGPSPTPPESPRQIPAATAAPRALTAGPITFFQASCARCHGAYGAMYGEALAKLSDADLSRFTEEMVVGPGQAELPPADLAAQVAWHRSLVDARPFVAITKVSDSTIEGEVTPGSTIEVVAGGQRSVAQVSGHTWIAPRPTGVPLAIEARLNEHTTTLDASAAAHSHPPP
jgi:hypothetical protein